MSSGEGAGTDYATMRGRDYPSIRQFTVFLENRVGQLLEVVRRFEGSNVRIVALTISDSTECAVVRFLLSDPEQGREVLERAGPGDRRVRPDRRRAARQPAAAACKSARRCCRPRSTSRRSTRCWPAPTAGRPWR